MPYFPMFVNIEKSLCVVVGGGKVALRKTKVLLDFNAIVTVVSPECSLEFEKLSRAYPLRIIRSPYKREFIKDAFIVIAATDKREVNRRVLLHCREEGIHVNIADKREECSFYFPSIVRRENLVIGISTSGRYPLLSKYLKEKINRIIPSKISRVLAELEITRGRKKIENIEREIKKLDEKLKKLEE